MARIPKNIDLPKIFFFLATVSTTAIVFTMLFFMIYIAYPVLAREGLGFVIGTEWSYTSHTYGIRNYILGTLWLTVTTLVLALPIGIFTAIFLAEIAPKWLDNSLRGLIELLVGIPSVVYGIFGFLLLENFFEYQINPFVSTVLGWIPLFHYEPNSGGKGIFLAAVILSVMVLPTIVTLSREAIKSVPEAYREASYAIGATRQETIFKTVLPAAAQGIITSVVLATMRAMGETMAVVMLLGGTRSVPTSIFDKGTVMTTKIFGDIGYYISQEEPRAALFGIAVVLFLIEMGFVASIRLISNHWKETANA
jgi:phosphate transport system permease protein